MIDPPSMNIDTSLKEWLSSVPDASRTLEILGVHLCGDDAIPLAEAATRAGLAPEEAVALLQGRDTSRDLQPVDWSKAPLSALAREIVEVYHRRTRYRLITLLPLSARAAAAHGRKHPELYEIYDELERMSRELVPHMYSEERYLFPYIASMESPGGVDSTAIVPLMGTVQHPMKSLQHQHAVDRNAFQKIRIATGDFASPPVSCEGVARLYESLLELDQELVNHLALEDGILFPRAVRAEKEIAERQRH